MQVTSCQSFVIPCCRCGVSALPSAPCDRGTSAICPACRTIWRSAASTRWSTKRSLCPFLPCALPETFTHCVVSFVTLTPDQTKLFSFGCMRIIISCGCKKCKHFVSWTLPVLHHIVEKPWKYNALLCHIEGPSLWMISVETKQKFRIYLCMDLC